MKKFEEDISAFREELINKKTNFNVGIPKLKFRENDSKPKHNFQNDNITVPSPKIMN